MSRVSSVLLVALILAALVALAGAAAAAPTEPDSSVTGPSAEPMRVYLPLTMRLAPAQPQGIYGRVTYAGAPAAGIPLALRRFDPGAGWTTALTTTTDSEGKYRFVAVLSLLPGQKYYVRYGTNQSDPNYVSDWWLPEITSYTAGQSVHGGDFDLKNIPLVSPPDDAARALPVTFQWLTRGIAGDSYRFKMFDPNSDKAWSSNDLGAASSFTLGSVPPGGSAGVPYIWYVRAHQGENSYGDSFEARFITLLNGSPAEAVGRDGQILQPERHDTR